MCEDVRRSYKKISDGVLYSTMELSTILYVQI
jgi:hypothetical protein